MKNRDQSLLPRFSKRIITVLTLASFSTLGGQAAAATLNSSGSPSDVPSKCGGWTVEKVASGFGALENLAFDNQGGLLLSETSALDPSQGSLLSLSSDGNRRKVANVASPGGIVVKDGSAYVSSGNAATSGIFGKTDGSIERIDLTTGERSTLVKGLTMPNGLESLPGNRWVVSRDLGFPSTLTLVNADGTLSTMSPEATSTNGLAFNPKLNALFVSETFNSKTVVRRIPFEDSPTSAATFSFPGWGPLNSADDMSFGPDGALYVAHNVGGRVLRIDPNNGNSCVVADHLWLTSSVARGAGPGWDENALYTTDFLGNIHKLSKTQP